MCRIIKLVYVDGPGPPRTEQQLSHLSDVLFALRYDITPTVRPTRQIPLGLSRRSCGVATFPLPLGFSQSSRDPSGQRGSSAWELEPGQIYSPMNSQQEETLIKHYNHTRRNTDRDLHWAFLAFWCPPGQSWEGAKVPNVGDLCAWVHLCACTLLDKRDV